MFSKKYFTISDFANLMGISRQTLIYYDNIDLFKPIKILDNKYRLYSRNQINVISLISILSEMGVPLKEIKKIVDDISPETALSILNKQLLDVEKKLLNLRALRDFIDIRIEQITLAKNITNQSISLCEIENDIPLYVGDLLNCTMEDLTDDMIIHFYNECEKKKIPLIFSNGQLINNEFLLLKQFNKISSLCFLLKDNTYANSFIPKGKYVVGYANNTYDSTNSIYNKMYDFIQKSNLKIIGNAYEEYLIDELAQKNSKDFIMQILIQVE